MEEISKKTIVAEADLAFEISWEVCNKVGGINTVLATKAVQMQKYYGPGYYLVGPYLDSSAKNFFEERKPERELQEIFDSLAAEGINCHFGRWIIDGEPKVILVDFSALWKDINQFKWQLWDAYQIDSLNSIREFDEPVVWGFAVAKLLEKLSQAYEKEKIVAHFHEWLAGAALLFAKKFGVKTATVFTTHATSLGRSMAFANVDFYTILDQIDAQKEAYRYGIAAKHLLERAAALNCDIFTTVSEITGVECDRFLNRMPDVFLPNGLDLSKSTSFEEVAVKHHIQRGRIREFLFYYFFPYYTFDLKNTLFYFIIGRYEFHAKGIDLLIKSLGEMNNRLKEEKSKKTIVTFFWIPAGVNGIEEELLENRSGYNDVKQFVEENSQDMVESFVNSILTGKTLKDTDVFDDKTHDILERKLKKTKREGNPLICTHRLSSHDETIMNAFQEAGLANAKSDRVKVVFYPVYLTEHDGILNLNVQGAIQGCHLGIFPSYYEPWGYTPLEAAVEGVAAVTSDMSGVGRFMSHVPRDNNQPGIFVINNFGKDASEAGKQLSGVLYDFSTLTRKDRVENKIKARELVEYCDWANLAQNYIEAHNKALKASKSRA
ncbi:MAG TPA: glycogen/starch synthase [Candidatus Paceibacterota bacterium]|nr:glycogen/starch synthase [Candidatus Pacearchaeota archaeon]HRZ50476.1 glycogen/starch synthase [Candidatus Paceibacterota bacterium]HSA36197.1 glycogen/starch synthase [Candidatus Paceibacterota bacterium]